MSTSTENLLDQLKQVIQQHWGYETLRPLQEPAMKAVLGGRDSLVVMPTGGGKSLCYQAPALVRGGVTVVVSPLISLMKDQVDALKACGVRAIQIDSSLTPKQRHAHQFDIINGDARLAFVSPERLTYSDFINLLKRAEVNTFAIDEAHCISHWGHDFRPEYRQLRRLKQLFPSASLHAYTATATEQVRKDISDQLALDQPEILVGNFDRPNLTYRVLPRQRMEAQVLEVLDRHKGEAGIIYCMRRRDVDDLTSYLRSCGHRVLAYHAGLSADARHAAQEEFAAEKCDLIVATVAFGMGIDRSIIRFVLHVAMPKSIEHYQQETGRAGRDGLEAECVLLFSGGDVVSWKRILEKSAANMPDAGQFLKVGLQHVNDMHRYCQTAVCRHRTLVQYFGQQFDQANCSACDICLGDTEAVADALIVAQKILSCVARLKERFGIVHVIGVLRGEKTQRIRDLGHDQLSTYGLLAADSQQLIRHWIHQLVDQEVLELTDVELSNGHKASILTLNAASWGVMRKERGVLLTQLVERKRGERAAQSEADVASWEGVDRELFEEMRNLRRSLAEVHKVPPYVIFSDATLRALARVRPSTLAVMRQCYGIGEHKLGEYGQKFLDLIVQQCRERQLSMDQADQTVPIRRKSTVPDMVRGAKQSAFKLFAEGASVESVVEETGRALSTVQDYLVDYILRERPNDVTKWIDKPTYDRVSEVARGLGTSRLKPIFVSLAESVPYEQIRLVVAHMQSQETPAAADD